jgi:predicted Holliday junction resolvase-like endonuclease
MTKNNLEVVISILVIIFILLYFGSLSSELVSVKKKLNIKEQEIRSLKNSTVRDSVCVELTEDE